MCVAGCDDCPMTLGNNSNYFGEIHTTVYAEPDFSDRHWSYFNYLCEEINIKALPIINYIRADREYQFMTATRVIAPMADIVGAAKAEAKFFEEHFVQVLRTKVELKPTPSIIYQYPDGYWEVHFDWKMDLSNINVAKLSAFNAWREETGLLDSANQLKMVPKKILEMISTYREDSRMSMESVTKRAELMAEKIREFTDQETRSILEYCIYDSNRALDDAWSNK